jgi:hypothetical protein
MSIEVRRMLLASITTSPSSSLVLAGSDVSTST